MTPRRAYALATSLRGRARANNGTGSQGGTRKRRTWNKDLIITFTQNPRKLGGTAQNVKCISLSASEEDRMRPQQEPKVTSRADMQPPNADLVNTDHV